MYVVLNVLREKDEAKQQQRAREVFMGKRKWEP